MGGWRTLCLRAMFNESAARREIPARLKLPLALTCARSRGWDHRRNRVAIRRGFLQKGQSVGCGRIAPPQTGSSSPASSTVRWREFGDRIAQPWQAMRCGESNSQLTTGRGGRTSPEPRSFAKRRADERVIFLLFPSCRSLCSSVPYRIAARWASVRWREPLPGPQSSEQPLEGPIVGASAQGERVSSYGSLCLSRPISQALAYFQET